MSDNNTVRYTGTARRWRHAGGYQATQDDPEITGLSKEEADMLSERDDFERVDGGETTETEESDDSDEDEDAVASVMSGTLGDLDDALESGEFDDRLGELFNFEQQHKDREGAYERIQDYGFNPDSASETGENVGLSDDYQDGMDDSDQEE